MADIYLTVNSLRLDRAGFCRAHDLSELLQQGRVRGDDFVSQGAAGRTFRTKIQDELRAMVGLYVFGDNDKDGTAHPDKWSGIRDNVEQIRTSCIDGSLASTVTATLTFPDAATRSASVYCPRLDVGLHRNLVNGAAVAVALEVVIPTGELT